MASGRRLTQEEFIKKSKSIHEDKYDYSLVKFINNKTKIKIICPTHNIFEQRVDKHLRGQGCAACVGKKPLTQKEFLRKAKEVHGERYDYSLVNYIGNSKKVIIICKDHGDFEQTPHSHMSGNGCLICSINFKKLSLSQFVEKSNKIHNFKYDYSLVNYTNNSTKINIICPTHDTFLQSPTNHLQGNGCPLCNDSKGEEKISEWLKSNKINFIREYKFKDCKNLSTKKYFRFDFYLPDFKMCIEFDGIQHYKPFSWSSNKSEEIKQKNLEYQQFKDKIKNQYCIDNSIKLIRIQYWKIRNINKILERILLNETK